MSDSSRPHGLQSTRFLRPWDFPGKSTGVGCHCLLLCFSNFLLCKDCILYESLVKPMEFSIGNLSVKLALHFHFLFLNLKIFIFSYQYLYFFSPISLYFLLFYFLVYISCIQYIYFSDNPYILISIFKAIIFFLNIGLAICNFSL